MRIDIIQKIKKLYAIMTNEQLSCFTNQLFKLQRDLHLAHKHIILTDTSHSHM